MRSLVPTLVTDETMEHIHSHPGRGHITKKEIREAVENYSAIESNRDDAEGDLIVTGKAYNGKKLRIYVKFIEDPKYYTEVCSARGA